MLSVKELIAEVKRVSTRSDWFTISRIIIDNTYWRGSNLAEHIASECGCVVERDEHMNYKFKRITVPQETIPASS